MALEIAEPFFTPGPGLFGIVDGDLMIAGNGDGFKVFPAEYRAHAGAAGGAFLADHSGVFHEVFPRRADTQPAEFRLAAADFLYFIGQRLLRFRDAFAPKVIGVVEEEFAVHDLEPGMLGAFAPEDQRIQPCALKVEAKGAAAARGR